MRRLCLLVALVAVGCITEGRNFQSDTAWIKVGQTKRPDVKMVLGDPYMIGSSSGSPTWTYGFYRYKLVGKSHTKELKIYWNPDGSIKNYSFNSNFPRDIDQRVGAGTKKGNR